MRRIIGFSIFSVLFFLLWGCSEKTDSPMSTQFKSGDMGPQEGMLSAEPETDTDTDALNWLGDEATFKIIIENVTPATAIGASQPLSPPVIATHDLSLGIFKPGHYASDELRQIAEDAVNGPMVQILKQSSHVFEIVEGGGAILPGTSAEYMIKTKKRYRWLSFVAMLVNTNDGFTGVSRLPLILPKNGKNRSFYLPAFDAGTEKNTELKSDIPGPCCGSPLVRVPTHERIRFHRGILGIGDLDPAIYDWNRKVAKVTIIRVD